VPIPANDGNINNGDSNTNYRGSNNIDISDSRSIGSNFTRSNSNRNKLAVYMLDARKL
jgi:hypothetical protein